MSKKATDLERTTICTWCGRTMLVKRRRELRTQANHYCSKECSTLVTRRAISRALKGHPSSRENGKKNQRFLQTFLDEHGPWNHSTVGKNLICLYCKNPFNTNPCKVRVGKAKFCSLACYDAHRHNPHIIEDRKVYGAARRARKRQAPINDLSAAQWREIKAAFQYRCAYCGKKSPHLTQDHITPLSKGGSHTFSNIVPACKTCNGQKWIGPPPSPVQPLLLTVAPGKEVKHG